MFADSSVGKYPKLLNFPLNGNFTFHFEVHLSLANDIPLCLLVYSVLFILISVPLLIAVKAF